MKRNLAALASTAVAFLLVGFVARVLTPHKPELNKATALVTEVEKENLERQFQRWKARHEANGGDRNVRLGLGFFPGLSVERSGARGTATLDLMDGVVSVEVYGLLDKTISEVWLVDNQPGGSTAPEPGDEMIFVGCLKHPGQAGPATLEVTLGPEVLADFHVDKVVVTKNGHDPVDGPVLLGSAGLFQRLYTHSWKPHLAHVHSHTQRPPLLGSPAFADDFGDSDGFVDYDYIVRGADAFLREGFEGNGRTCGTCHPEENNFTIDPAYIATLPDDDPLFIVEQGIFPTLTADAFGPPELLRRAGLVLEHVDGFDKPGVLRAVPHLFSLSATSVPPNIPFDNTSAPDLGIFPPEARLGWGGDGALSADPSAGGDLRDMITVEVIQHFPKLLPREVGPSFRLPTDSELDSMEAFLRSIGRTEDLNLDDFTFKNPMAAEGKKIFNSTGLCFVCHVDAGANIDVSVFLNALPGLEPGNANFATGVNDLPSLPADLILAANGSSPSLNPRDGGFGRVSHDPADGFCVGGRPGPDGAYGFGTVTPDGRCVESFNPPSLIEAADTAPFFHNNAIKTMEGAVEFYNSDAFNNSPAAGILQSLIPGLGSPAIQLAVTEVEAVACFLNTINVALNINCAINLEESAKRMLEDGNGNQNLETACHLLENSLTMIDDAMDVLVCMSSQCSSSLALQKLEEARALDELVCSKGFIDFETLPPSLNRCRGVAQKPGCLDEAIELKKEALAALVCEPAPE